MYLFMNRLPITNSQNLRKKIGKNTHHKCPKYFLKYIEYTQYNLENQQHKSAHLRSCSEKIVYISTFLSNSCSESPDIENNRLTEYKKQIYFLKMAEVSLWYDSDVADACKGNLVDIRSKFSSHLVVIYINFLFLCFPQRWMRVSALMSAFKI